MTQQELAALDASTEAISQRLPQDEQVYVGVAFDKAKESITMASFEEGSEAKAREEAEKLRPGLPIFTFRLFDKPSNIQKALFAFLTEQGVPDSEHLEILGLICQGLRDGIKL
jgi:hypothetical protein